MHDLKEKNPDVEIISEYKKSSEKARFRCKICGHEWLATPSSVIAGSACPNYRSHSGYMDSKTLSHKEFMQRLDNPDIEVLGKYKGMNVPIEVRCKKCSHRWLVKPNNLLRGTGCPNFLNHDDYGITTEQFKEELSKVNPDIEVLGEYVRATVKTEVMCKICGHKWSSTPDNLIHGYGCPNWREHKGRKK